jgi:hypothetical protein
MMNNRLQAVPISIREANAFVEQFHRHSVPVQGAKFAIGASVGEHLQGVAIVGRPVARMLHDGFTAEVLRCCVLPDAQKNTPSFLYGRCWRVWQQMGGRRMVTYTLASESGASLRAAGWKILGETEASEKGKGWMNRPGRAWRPVYGQQKLRWEPVP